MQIHIIILLTCAFEKITQLNLLPANISHCRRLKFKPMQPILDETDDPHPAGINSPLLHPRNAVTTPLVPAGPTARARSRPDPLLFGMDGDEEVRYWPN